MKNITIFLALAFTVMFSSPSFADWKEVGENVKGHTFYVDFERIRKQNGYVYWWELTDLLKPNKDGDLSYKRYTLGDCKLFRVKRLMMSFHNELMGRGTPVATINKADKDWIYPPPNSSFETILNEVCAYAK